MKKSKTMLHGYRHKNVSSSTKKMDDIWKNIAEHVETRFCTSNYEFGRPLPKGKNKKVTGLMKNEFVGLRAKTYS